MYRQPLIESGRTYRAKLSFASVPTFLRAGELLVFTGDTYSPHDDAFVYSFRDADGTEKQWCLGDGQPKEVWTRYFEFVSTPMH